MEREKGGGAPLAVSARVNWIETAALGYGADTVEY